MPKITEDMNTALRTMGHLLEHHPTTEYYARDKWGIVAGSTDSDACSWCFVGAIRLVARRICKNDNLEYILENEARRILGWADDSAPTNWDCGTDAQRLEWARELQKVGL